MKKINILEYLESSLIGKKLQGNWHSDWEGGTIFDVGFHPQDSLICLLVEKEGKRGFAYYHFHETINFTD